MITLEKAVFMIELELAVNKDFDTSQYYFLCTFLSFSTINKVNLNICLNYK